jgi:DNA-binding transcriptional MerR regulator
MKEFLSIREFSKFSGIAATTLRFWDDIGLFSPQKRNPENNYRYYTPDQIIAVNFIKVLSDLKVPLKTIGDADQIRNPGSIVNLIKLQEMKLQRDMDELRARSSIMFTRREMILYGMTVEDTTEIAVMRREDLGYILGPRNEFNDNDSFYEPFIRFCQAADELRINLSAPIGGYHENMEHFLDRPGKPDYFFSIDQIGNRRRPAGDYLTGFSRGYYGGLDDVAERMQAYAKDNALTLSGPVYVTYLHDEICMKDPSKYLAQICVAVSKRKKRR